MSEVRIEDAGWQAIMDDERLKRARKLLSFHELRLIIDHARNNHSRNVLGFLNEIMERTPNGEQIRVQYHPNGDWSVAKYPLPITGDA